MEAFTVVAVGFLFALSAGVSIAQNGHMMDGGGWMGGIRRRVGADRPCRDRRAGCLGPLATPQVIRLMETRAFVSARVTAPHPRA